MAIEIVDRCKVHWRIRRRWVTSGGARWRGPDADAGMLEAVMTGGLDFGLGGFVTGFLLVVAAAAVLLLLFVVVFPAIAFVLELLLVASIALLGIFGRVLFGLPWTIEAEGGHTLLRWRVKGWRASREAMAEVAAALERGESIPRPFGLEPTLVTGSRIDR